MAGGFFHIFELGAVCQRRCNDGGPHRVCRVAAVEPEAGGELLHHAVDGVRVHRATFSLPFFDGTQRLEQGTVEVRPVAGESCRRG